MLEHALADSWDFQNFLRLANDFGNLLRQTFNGFGSIAIRPDAERILPIDFHQVGGFVQDAHDGFVVHRERLNNCTGMGKRANRLSQMKSSLKRWRSRTPVFFNVGNTYSG